MSAILPDGLVAFRDASATVAHALFSGEPERLEVIQLRISLGHHVGDGVASSKANAAIWRAVDDGSLRLVAVGGRPRRTIELDPDFTQGIPLLRRVQSFVYLRPWHPEWEQVTGWFGINVATIALAFHDKEVKKLANRLRRARQRARPSTAKSNAGRPSNQQSVRQSVELIVNRRQWTTKRSIKELTVLVNRSAVTSKEVSEDTVLRALNWLDENTHDRRYARVRRIR